MNQKIQNLINKVSKKAKKSVKEVEIRWKQAVEITQETFGKNSFTDFTDKEFTYASSILHTFFGLNRFDEKINLMLHEFLRSDKYFTEFYSEYKEQISGSISGVTPTNPKKVVDLDSYNVDLEEECDGTEKQVKKKKKFSK